MPALRKKKAGTAVLRRRKDDPTSLEHFLEDLAVEINSKCETIKWKADAACDMIKNAYANEIFKLPKNIRSMNVREFESKFGGDISLVIEHDRKKICESLNVKQGSNATVARSTRSKSRFQNGTVRRSNRLRSAVPAMNPLLPKTPAAGRIRATLNVDCNDSDETGNPTIAVSLPGGKNISLNDVGAETELTQTDKKEALAQLQALQDSVLSLMQRIKGDA
mmetsp:Transcript_8185/g.9855  ORF Transcript_8185/g.9855 Transcript_8185/m.9855 type:complete len:221 (+) Transcript_8185:190-852(+)